MDQSILALIAFTFTASMTPGPNNIMLMASGVNHGLRRSLPHMAGVCFGFPVMVMLISVGLGASILALPWFHDVISAIGIVYLLWLAWRIGSADPRGGVDHGAGGRSEPMGFLAASAFQWVNAKAWVMAIGVVAVYAPRGYGVIGGLAIVVAVVFLIGMISTFTWTAFGSLLATWLRDPLRLRIFNTLMAGLLVATLVPAVVELVHKYG